MGYHILNSKGEICGWTETPFEPAEGQRLIDEKDYHPDPRAALAAAKTAKLHAAAEAAQAFIERVAGLDGVRARLMGGASFGGASMGDRQKRAHTDTGRHRPRA